MALNNPNLVCIYFCINVIFLQSTGIDEGGKECNIISNLKPSQYHHIAKRYDTSLPVFCLQLYLVHVFLDFYISCFHFDSSCRDLEILERKTQFGIWDELPRLFAKLFVNLDKSILQSGQIHVFKRDKYNFLFVQIHLGAKSQFRIRDELPRLFAKSAGCQLMVLYFSPFLFGTICWPLLETICWSSKLEHKIGDGVLKQIQRLIHVILTKVKTTGQT